ncbi:MAG TPA: winged helix-turn-helix domain-containing protein [Blastocatellia bacterium]|nr:winged helix-turn-helix domain-containing protein [Blastocatellia bacterium]
MHAISSDNGLIRFGEFELEPRSGELRKAGVPVKLQPQPLRVLVLLASNPGELVTREEIQQAIWEGVTFVDFEHGLNFCIKQIRAALGDNAQAPRFIETLPRRGYRFIAAVDQNSRETSQIVAASVLGDSTTAPTLETGISIEEQPVAQLGSSGARSRVARAAVLVIALLLIAGGYAAWKLLAKSPLPSRGKVMLGVMPFENLSADPEQEYFSDGMTEELIAQLGSLQPSKLGVIARTSAMTYKRGNRDIGQIGSELKVDYVLEGSVRREGDRVRITAQLIQVSDQTHLWSESYDRSTQNTLEVQTDVARNIARVLALKLLPGERTSRTADASVSSVAYDAFLKGRYLWNKGRADDVEKSIGFYNQALELAPDYGPALAGLADSYILLGMYYTMAPTDAYSKAKPAATRALELDDGLAEAHTAMGTILFRFDWAWPEAEARFKRAIELNPSYGRAHHDYAWLLVALERFDEAVNEIKRAQELDPLSPLANSDVGWVYLRARRYDDAINQIERTLELEPEFASAQACLERAYRLKGMNKEVVVSARKSMIRSGATPQELAALDDVNSEAAMRNVLLWRLKRAEASERNRPTSPYRFAAQHAELGNNDAAFEWLERAFNERDSEFVSLKVDPAFDGVRADPRYASLLRRIGF